MWSLAEVIEGKLAGVLSKPEIERMETIAQWCRSYILQEHPELGRAGPVCPWCPASVARGHFYLTHANVRFGDEATVVADLYNTRDQYLQMSPDSGPDQLLKTVLYVISFTDKEPVADELRNWMVRLHRRAKPGFLSKGLMLGEFFPNHSATGLRSDAFNPLRSPIPLFVIRSMVPLDITFLSDHKEYAEAYFAKFAEDSMKHIHDVLSISPIRLARSKLRSLLAYLYRSDLQNSSIDGRDVITGALLKESGLDKLQRILDKDRASRPPVNIIVLQPRGLGKDIESGSLEHLEWLWHTAHVLRSSVGADDFIFRDGDRLAAVLIKSSPLEVRQVAQLFGAASCFDGFTGTICGQATEGVRHLYSEEQVWDEAECPSGSSLLASAYTDLAIMRGCE
jgi:hypothetical protein